VRQRANDTGKPASSKNWITDAPLELDVETALAVLEDALNCCRREDMHTPEVFAALDFLEPRASRKRPFDQFRNSLTVITRKAAGRLSMRR
jgi:hypothetical protein